MAGERWFGRFSSLDLLSPVSRRSNPRSERFEGFERTDLAERAEGAEQAIAVFHFHWAGRGCFKAGNEGLV